MCIGYIDYRYWLFTICVIVTFASKEGVDMKLSTLRAIKLLPINWLTLQSPTDGHVNEMWLIQIFLDCVGYQQYFHFKLVQ